MRTTIPNGALGKMNEDSEEIYDRMISPLMVQIIAICKEHKIPMVASFQFSDDGLCTTRIPFKGETPKLAQAERIITQRDDFFAFTITGPKP